MAYCRECGVEIGEARFCPECGAAQEQRAAGGSQLEHMPSVPSAADSKPKKGWTAKRTLTAVVLGVIGACLCISVLAVVLGDGDGESPAEDQPTAVADATRVGPIGTPGPAATPTNTPEPSATPTPKLLTYADIEQKKKDLTDLQWEVYMEEVVGERIRFAGDLIEVYDDGRVQIDEGKGLISVCVLYEVPLDIAATLNKDQYVKGTGTVREVNTTLGLAVWINVETLE